MNKGVKIILLVVASALIVFLVDFFTSGKSSEEKQLPSDNKVVKEFEKKSETIATSTWNKSSYNSIISELQMYRDQKTINTVDGNKIESFLQVSYAKSLVNSFEEWKKTNGNKSVTELYDEINNINQIAECKPILQNALETLQEYNLAMQLPKKIDNLLSLEYNKVLCTNAKDNILSICSSPGISTFPSIQTIKSVQLVRVFDFEKFATDFIATKNLWQGDPTDYVGDFIQYCPDGIHGTETIKYSFYLQQFNQLDICP